MDMDKEEIFSDNSFAEDNNFAIRPTVIDDYVGQDKIIENLKVFVKASMLRNETLDHCLLYGPPGLGKTTLAHIISNELSVNIRATSGPVIEKAGDLAAIVTNLSDRDVLFIDEIHRLHPSVEEILYPAMEDYKLDLVIGQGPAARTIKIDLERFTLIGATTRLGLLTSPLRDRFGITFRLDFYSMEELKKIVIRSSGLLNVEINNQAAFEIARRSRGTPRIANRLLRRIRDYAQLYNSSVIDFDTAVTSLGKLDIDSEGLDLSDRSLMDAIIRKYDGGPVGVDTLAASISEEKGTIEDVIEPFLIYKGFLKKTSKGRVATRLAYKHMNLPYKKTLHESSIEDFIE